LPLAGHLAGKVTPASPPPAIADAPYCVTVNVPASSAVHRTASGRAVATIKPPRGTHWTGDGALAYDWSGPQPGVWLIPPAPSPGSWPLQDAVIAGARGAYAPGGG
jgi:hypothetical protein